MKKIFLFILALCAATMAWGEDVTISKSIKEIAAEWAWPEGGTEGVQIPSFRLGQATVTVTGNNGYYYSSETSWKWHCYMAREKGEFTITVPSVCKLKSVTFSFTGKNSGDAVNYNGTNYASGASIAIVGLQTASFTVGNTKETTGGQVRLSSISLTYEVEKGVTEDFNKVPTFGTSDTKASGVLDWNVHRVRHSSDKMSDGTSIGCCTWGDNDATAHNSYMETQKGFEGGIKYVEVLWKQMGSEKNNTMKLVAYSDDANPKTIFEQAIGNTGLSGDHITGVEIEAKSNAVLKIQNESFVTATPATGAAGRFTIGSITIVPYLRYTYTEMQEVKIGEGTFDCSLQIDNTDNEGTITYGSDNEEVAKFADNTATATLVGGGEATITATWSEGASTSFKLKVIAKSTPEISFENEDVTITDLYTTEPVENKLTVTEGAGEVTYNSSNPLVAKIVSNQVTVVGAGAATITATTAENEDYVSASASYALTVNEPEGETAVKENFKGKLAKQDSYAKTEASFTDQLGLYSWKANGYRYNETWVRLATTDEPYLKFDGNQEGGIKRLVFNWFRAGSTPVPAINTKITVVDGETQLAERSIVFDANDAHGSLQPYNVKMGVKQNAQLIINNFGSPAVMHFQDIKIVPYLLFTTKSDEAFLSLVDEYDIKNVLIDNTDDGEVVYSILTEGAKSQISNDGVVTFTNVTESETITIQAAWTPDGESSATVITTMTLYVDAEYGTDKTVEEKFSNYGETGWASSEANEVTKTGDVYDWRTKLTRHKTSDKVEDNQQAIWFAQGGYVATADATDNTKVGPAEGGIKRIAFDWNQNGDNQAGDDLYISISVDDDEVSAIRRDGGARPEQPWQYIHNLNVKKNATLKIENKSTTSKSEGGRVKIGTIVITPYLLYTTKDVNVKLGDLYAINVGICNNTIGGAITYTSLNPDVASIANDDPSYPDKLKLNSVGDAVIVATWTPDGSEEVVTTSYTLHVTEKEGRNLSFQKSVKETTVGGSAVTNTLIGYIDDADQTWSTASEGAITSVNNEGLVSPVAIGTDIVTVNVAESENYQAGTASYKVIVRSGVDDDDKLVESFSGISKDASTSETEWKGDLKDYFSWKVKSTRHIGTAGDTIGGKGVAGTVLYAKGQIATDIEGGIKYFTFNWKQPYVEPGATLRLTLNAGDKAYQQDYVVATDNGSTTHEHLYFAGDMQVKKNVQLILKNESFKTESGDPLTSNGRIAIDKFEIVPYLF
ncbi:MAG: hypothetical protein MJZ20_12245, partial [Bacteroidaceae bacterium]|nr:hypothetical protein [Bacteroidaceae bacterium]